MGFTAIAECIIAAAGMCTVAFSGPALPAKGVPIVCLTSEVRFPVRPMHCWVKRKGKSALVTVRGEIGSLHSVIVEVRGRMPAHGKSAP